MEQLKKVRQVLLYTLILNIAVASTKIFYGYSIDSVSMLSDGFHSLLDGTSNVIGLIGVWIASQPADDDHPYGHRKYETLATIAIAVLILAAGIGILREAYSRMQEATDIRVSVMSFVVMGITLAVNIWVMRYESRKGRELKSEFLLADALHTRTDIYISISVIVSLIAAKAGYPAVDIMAAGVITLFIAGMGIQILKSATVVLTDAVRIAPEKVRMIALGIEGVKDCHGIRTRGKDDFINLDLHIQVDPELKVGEAHEKAHAVERAIKEKLPSVKDVVIHVEPFKDRG